MGKYKTSGLFKRGDIWHIDKRVCGYRLRESTGTVSFSEAGRFLAKRMEEIRQASVYGVRPKCTFLDAAIKYIRDNKNKADIRNDGSRLKKVVHHIGNLPLNSIHMGTLQIFIEERKKEGVKMRTINHGLKLVRRILNLAANEWMSEYGLTWLAHVPKIKLLPEPDLRPPNPLTWEEQERFFVYLPLHLQRMANFAVNTGCRDAEICHLRWEWEVLVPALNTNVFILPAHVVKNREERLIVLNKKAQAIIEEVRGIHPTHVFTYRGHPVKRILNSAWKRARLKTKIDVRVHDLRHTFGRRLRAAGVCFEDRQDLLGHKSGRMTTHYSAVELRQLIDATNQVCVEKESAPTLIMLKRASRATSGITYEESSHIFPTVENERMKREVITN